MKRSLARDSIATFLLGGTLVLSPLHLASADGTVLHAAGLPQDGFGQKDVTLGAEIDQSCPLEHLLA